ncbi:uncharacterized protein LOC141889322 isoform X2 [Acropora palmata]|uniref:uncharacterized protein LOC141889322 isoform X2 n=1 Tax=Acropora palmata TaxID=6131 RepID=UPI003DA10AEB
MSLRRDFIARVQKELKQLQSLKPHGIRVTLPSDSLQIWQAVVPGPNESLYKGKTILLDLHRSSTGHICLGLLSEENWLPTRCVLDVLSALFSLLIKPELENPADQAILNIFNDNRRVYEDKARKSARNSQ